MHPIRKRKVIIIFFVLCSLSLVVALVLYALRANISLFYTPTQVRQHLTHPEQSFRLGGMVKQGSVVHLQGLKVIFVLTDFKNEVTVEYTGLLPDLFREGQGVVVQGKLSSKGKFMAQEVLAKHDENYRPKLEGKV